MEYWKERNEKQLHTHWHESVLSIVCEPIPTCTYKNTLGSTLMGAFRCLIMLVVFLIPFDFLEKRLEKKPPPSSLIGTTTYSFTKQPNYQRIVASTKKRFIIRLEFLVFEKYILQNHGIQNLPTHLSSRSQKFRSELVRVGSWRGGFYIYSCFSWCGSLSAAIQKVEVAGMTTSRRGEKRSCFGHGTGRCVNTIDECVCRRVFAFREMWSVGGCSIPSMVTRFALSAGERL